MGTFAVYRNSTNSPAKAYEAAKDGFSWPGFWFTWIWALTRGLTIATLILGTGMGNAFSQAPANEKGFAICADEFVDRDYQGTCSTQISLEMKNGELLFGRRGQNGPAAIQIGGGRLVPFCAGSKHTVLGEITLFGYAFKSDEEDPLQFQVDRDKGYVYLGGKGSVTMPNGKVVELHRPTTAATDGMHALPSHGVPAEETSPAASGPVSFSMDHPTHIDSVPKDVQTGTWLGGRLEIVETELVAGEETGDLRATVTVRGGTLPLVDEGICICCAETISIGPDLEVPLNPFFSNIKIEALDVVETRIYTDGRMTYTFSIPKGRTSGTDSKGLYITTGASGAVLRKQAQDFLLVEGEATLIREQARPQPRFP